MFPIPSDRLRVFTPFLREMQSFLPHNEDEKTMLTFNQLSMLFREGVSIDYLLFGSGACCNTTDTGKLLQERINQYNFAQKLSAMLSASAIETAETHHVQTPVPDKRLLVRGH